MNIGNKISDARKKQNLTQEQLAELMGVTRQSVSRWESNLAYPEMEKVVQLCKILDISCDYLLKDEDQKEGKQQSTTIHTQRWRYEYVSKKKIFGRPLVHVNIGFGVYRAKGIIAIGNIATGFLSIGLLSCGLFSLGVLSLGLLSFGTFCLGLISIGAIAVGIIAIGAIALGIFSIGAISIGYFSVGALSIAKYVAIGDNATGMIAIGRDVSGSIYESGFDYDKAELYQAIDQNVPKTWQVFINMIKVFLR